MSIKEKKIKTKWDLTMFYKSEKDPQIQKDIDNYIKSCKLFAKKYKKNKNYLKNSSILINALQDYENLINILNDSKPLLYFYYRKHINSEDKEAQAQISKLTNIFTKAINEILFFTLELGKISKQKQKEFLKNKNLKKYRHFLQRRFLTAKYDLSENEEKILNLTELPSHILWTKGVEKTINKRLVRYKGKDLPLPEASNLIPTLPTLERRSLHKKVMTQCKAVSDFAESEINAIITNKKLQDELRGLKHPYSGFILSNENSEDEIISLVNAVTDSFETSRKFYKTKAKLLGLKKLKYADRTAKIGKMEKEYSFQHTYKITRDTLLKMDPEFAVILDKLLENGQIDVYPKKGKTGGAFCSGSSNTPTLILLNHVDKFRSVTTFAHEMGHAIHTELAKIQSPLYQEYSLSTAETASTLFEGFIFEKLTKDLSKEEKIIALHDKIQEDISSIHRQIACFNFETELHMQIRKKGFLAKEEISNLLVKHMKSYLGPIFEMDESDGYQFVTWTHLRMFFYVYTYAYGNLVSKALAQKIKEDSRFIKEVKKFLSLAGSDSPANIFKSIGIDTTKADFFKLGLMKIHQDVEKLEKLANR